MSESTTSPSVSSSTARDAVALRARTGVYLVFTVVGFVMANWLARLPAVRDTLELTPSRLGFVLIGISVGSLVALPLSGPVVHRLGPERTVRFCAVLTGAGIAVGGLAGGGLFGGIPLLLASMFVCGVGIATWDVAMNVEGAAVEQRLKVAIMPWFHAAYSLGTVAGALTGSGAAALGVGVTWHMLAVAVFSVAVAVPATRRFLPRESLVDESGEASRPHGSGAAAAWRERRTLLVGLLALGMGLSEGSAQDWIAVGAVDGFGLTHAQGAVALGLFLTAMTSCRFAGPWLLARFGRVFVLRSGAVSVVVGLLLYVGAGAVVDTAAGVGAANAGALAMAALGVVLWGLGAALGFPVAMSAAADDPARAAARVSVVASIGYISFLAGPPLLGLLGDRVGVVRSLLLVCAAAALALVVAGAARGVDDSAPAAG